MFGKQTAAALSLEKRIVTLSRSKSQAGCIITISSRYKNNPSGPRNNPVRWLYSPLQWQDWDDARSPNKKKKCLTLSCRLYHLEDGSSKTWPVIGIITSPRKSFLPNISLCHTLIHIVRLSTSFRGITNWKRMQFLQKTAFKRRKVFPIPLEFLQRLDSKCASWLLSFFFQPYFDPAAGTL